MPNMNPTGKGGMVAALALLGSWMIFVTGFSIYHALLRLDSLWEIGNAFLLSWPMGIGHIAKAKLAILADLLWIPVILAVPYGAGFALMRVAGFEGKTGDAPFGVFCRRSRPKSLLLPPYP